MTWPGLGWFGMMALCDHWTVVFKKSAVAVHVLDWSLFAFSDLNECTSNPCRNGGTCRDEISFYWCDCPYGWAGFNCEYRELFFSLRQLVNTT